MLLDAYHCLVLGFSFNTKSSIIPALSLGDVQPALGRRILGLTGVFSHTVAGGAQRVMKKRRLSETATGML